MQSAMACGEVRRYNCYSTRSFYLFSVAASESSASPSSPAPPLSASALATAQAAAALASSFRLQSPAAAAATAAVTMSPVFKSSLASVHQSICHAEAEHFVPAHGKESSITLDLVPNRIQMGPCKRTFVAPESHDFIVKLVKFRSKQMRNPNSHIDANAGGVAVDVVYNHTTTCPLVIVSFSFVFYSISLRLLLTYCDALLGNSILRRF